MNQLNIEKNQKAKLAHEAMIRLNTDVYSTIRDMNKSKTFVEKNLEHLYDLATKFKDSVEILLPKLSQINSFFSTQDTARSSITSLVHKRHEEKAV